MTNVGFRLGAAGQVIELRQAENDPLFSVEYEVIEREAGNRAAATDAMSALGRLLPVAEINS